MKIKPFATWILGCLISIHCLSLSGATVDDSARMLAGLSATPSTAPASLSNAAYTQYSRSVNENWKRYENRVYLPITNWFKGELPPLNSPVVFYPFSGPDFPTLNAIYPSAEHYVMVAIQSAGKPVDMDSISASDSQSLTSQISKASHKFGHIGFFLTNDLEENAAKKGMALSPTLTLMFFVSRLGFTIESIQPLQIGPDGSAIPVDPENSQAWHSVRFEIKKEGRKVTLDYLRIDLSDNNLLKAESQRQFVEHHAKFPTLLKAASHLPQNGGFSIIRNAIVNSAPLVVQDETGIDYGLLARNFSVQLYGGFTRPHHLFNQDRQKSLAEAYAKSTNVRPLPFIVGYNKQSGASLQIAARSTPNNEIARTPEKPVIANAKPEHTNTPAPVENPVIDSEAKPVLVQAKVQTSVPSAVPKLAARTVPAAIVQPITPPVRPAPAPDRTEEASIFRLPERTLYLSYQNTKTAHTAYLSKASSILLEQLAPSKAYFQKDQWVVMTIKVERTGSIRSVEVDRSSGNAQLDKDSVFAIRKLKSLPRFPESLAAATDVLGIVLSFPAE